MAHPPQRYNEVWNNQSIKVLLQELSVLQALFWGIYYSFIEIMEFLSECSIIKLQDIKF